MPDEAVAKIKKMYRAKMYMDDMRQGIDPVSKLPVSADSVIRQEKVVNCLTFVSELLDELISGFEPKNGVPVPDAFENLKDSVAVGAGTILKPFRMSDDQVSNVTITKVPITVSVFIRNINKVLDRKTTKPIRAKDINGWLAEKGFIEERAVQVIKEDKEYFITKQASEVGLLLESKPINNGQSDMHFIKFDRAGQQFILDNIDEIAEYAKKNK